MTFDWELENDSAEQDYVCLFSASLDGNTEMAT